MRKILVVLVAIMLVWGMVNIFGVAETTPVEPSPSAQPETSPDAEAAPTAGGSVYYLNFKPEQADQWVQLSRIYTDKTGVPVTVMTAASNTYEDTLRSELEKAEAPTMFQVNGPVGLRRWRDYCADMKDTALYQNLKSDDFALIEDGKVLGIAYVIETYGLIYNKELLDKYCQMDNAVIKDASEIDSFDTLKAVAEDIQARKEELGVRGAFASAGLDSSSNWRYQTHLANLPIYYEYQKDGVATSEALRGDYIDQYKAIFDLYINNSTCDPAMLGAKTMADSTADFTLGEAVFYQNGTWAYTDCINEGMTDDQLGMLPIFIGAEGEENQGLCTGSENYWCLNAKASPEDLKATEDFLEWVVTSDEGRDMMANQMGFATPFKAFDDGYVTNNPLIRAADAYIDAGKTPVSWNFATIPSQKWKDDLGAALLEYAQGTGDWEAVKTAFVEGWATEYAAQQTGDAAQPADEAVQSAEDGVLPADEAAPQPGETALPTDGTAI